VVLLDEIEKAHPDVYNLLLQVFDDGRLTDGQGRTVDFTNVVFIMTSNLPGDPLEFFRPEFINRIDDIIRFRPLNEDDLAIIVGIQLGRLRQRLAQRRLALDLTPAAAHALAAEGFDPAYGARPLKRVIQRRLEDPLALAVLQGSTKRATRSRSTRSTASSPFTNSKALLLPVGFAGNEAVSRESSARNRGSRNPVG